MNIDIAPQDLKTIKALLHQYLPHTLVWAFGSRVKFTAKPSSDLDLVAFSSQEQAPKLSLLKEAFEQSNIPFRIDLHQWNELPETFHQYIENHYAILQANTQQNTPNNWKTYKLGEIAERITSGGTPSTKKTEYYGGSIPWLRTQEVNFNRIYNTEIKITDDALKNSSAKIIDANSIIVAMYGATAGRIAINKIPLTTNQACCNITIDKNKADYNFVYYFLQSKFGEIFNMATGAAQQNLNAGMLKDFEITIPDLATQTQIAEILSSLDDKIELNLQMNQTLEAIAQALFKEWFVEFKFPNFDGTLENGLPKGWRMGKLGEVARIEIGRTPPRLEGEWFSKDEKDNKWISIRDMGQSGIYIFNTSECLTNEAVKKFRIPVIPENTVVLSFKLTIGRVAITTEEMLSNEAIAQINSIDFSPEYIYLYLKTYNWDSLGSTSSIATAVNSKTIKEMDILIPNKEISGIFTKILKPIFEKIKSNTLQIRTLTEARDALLPKLMSGQIAL